MKKYIQLIPDKIYDNLDLINKFLQTKIQGYNPDNLKEVISIIACHTRKDNGPAPLQIKDIKRLVPQGDKYLKGLIDLQIIERSGNFVPEQTSYLYDFAEGYKSKFISLPLENMKLIRRIEQVQMKLTKDKAKSIRGRSEQTQYLKKLTIDPGFNEWVENIDEVNPYNAAVSSATRILNKDIFYSIDTTSGRFHSNVTNLAKGLRPYLRVNGEPLVNIDIKNSQPYLSTILLTDPGKVSWMTENPAFALLLQSLKVTITQDVKKYISLVISGNFYEYLMKKFADNGLNLTRAETKIQVLRILFARNRKPKDEINRKARDIFINNFPKVHRIFSKVRGKEKGNKFTNFKRFAILLQKIEAYLILDIVLKRIYRELPGTIAITIHDSILTGILTNNVEAVRKIIDEELTFFIGFRPQINIESNKGIIKGKEGENKVLIQYNATTSVYN